MDAPITQWLSSWRAGDVEARDRLVASLYPELRRLAQGLFRNERGNHTLQPTALVSEAWLRLSGSKSIAVEDRGHLLAIAARLMREILIDHARRRDAAKRGGPAGREKVTLSGLVDERPDGIDTLALDQALVQLEAHDPRKVRVVELRWFAGLEMDDIAGLLGISRATAQRDWEVARSFLFQALA